MACSLVFCSHADTFYITASDTPASKTSFATWDVCGTPQGAPSSGNDYVCAGFSINAPNSGATQSFGGNSLCLGDASQNKAGDLILRRTASTTVSFSNSGLILEQGRILPGFTALSKAYTFTGTIDVKSSLSLPFEFCIMDDCTNHVGTSYVFGNNVTFKGNAGSGVAFVNRYDESKGSITFNPNVNNFAGTFIIGGGSPACAVKCELRGSPTMSGGIWIKALGEVVPQYASTLWTVGTLRLDAGSTWATKLTVNQPSNVPVTSTITLTDGLITAYPVNLAFTQGARKETDSTYGYEWAVLRLPKDKAEQIHPEHFVLASQNTSFPKDDFYVGLIVRTNENDVSLNVISRKRVYMTEPLDSGKRGFGYDPYYEYYTAATNAAAWSDGNALGSPDIDYVSGSHLNLAPPSLCDDNHAYVFPGASLTMSNSTTLCTAARLVTFPVLRMMTGSQFWPLTDKMSETTVVRGQIHLVNTSANHPAYLRVRNRMSVDVQADLTSASGGCLQVQPNATNAVSCRITFGHDNSAYTNRIFIAGADKVTDFENGQTLVLQAANNVGGPLTRFMSDALSLFRFATLEVTNDLVFATANRGLTVENAQIKVGADATFTFANDITYNGPLVKTGAGRLVLGGTAKGTAKTLTVTEGTLAVSTDTALDDVNVTFAGGALAVDPETAGQYGMKGPFSGNLPVAFDLPADEDTHEYSDIAVCTVDASANVSPKVVRIPRHRVVFTWRDNGDGTKTLLADISRTGLAIILR